MWLPFHVHTYYSLMDGICKPKKLALKIKEYGYSHCAVTDHGNISCAIEFAESMQKEGIIPVIGSEFYISDDPASQKMDHMVVMAKNLQGYYTLVKLTSLANKNAYYKPRITLKELADAYDKNILVFSGHAGSYLHRNPDKIEVLKEAFGDDFYLENQRFTNSVLDISDNVRELSMKYNIRNVACADIHYINREDAAIQRIALCSNLKLELPQVELNLAQNKDVPMSSFFTCDDFFLPTNDDLVSFGHTPEEIDCSDILSKIEPFDMSNKPDIPKMIQDVSEIEYIKNLCREGWKKRVKNDWNIDEYVKRLEYELEIIEEFNLAGYLLIIWDFISYAKKKKILVGPGRGSAAGSLVCYMIGITEVDPMKHGLIFERFINVSRCYPSHISFQEFNYLENYKKV